MGGCDIRSAAEENSGPSKYHQFRQKPEHEITVKNGMVFLFKSLASAVGVIALLLFLLGFLGVIPKSESEMIGIVTILACGMFWGGLDYFRRIIGAGPESHDEESIKKYFSSSVIGALIRSLGLLVGFAAPMLWVISRYQGDGDLKIAAIVCGVVCVLLYSVAAQIEEFFYGKLNDD